MMNHAPAPSVWAILFILILSACSNPPVQEEQAVRPVVPVTIASPHTGYMAEYAELMATSAFQIRTQIKSPVTGYIEKCLVTPGDHVTKNQVLYLLKTREAEALALDTTGTIRFSGQITIRATINGVVASVEHPQGDFVQEGDALSSLVEPGSLVFLLDMPYELKNLLHTGETCRLVLPDGSGVSAEVRSILPSMSGTAQTQRVVLKPSAASGFPENLTVKARLVRKSNTHALILPKCCVLSDEVMKHFWVMKLINDTTAVKINIETGIRGTDSIEVLPPAVTETDRILSSGNYGIGDTVKVMVTGKGR